MQERMSNPFLHAAWILQASRSPLHEQDQERIAGGVAGAIPGWEPRCLIRSLIRVNPR